MYYTVSQLARRIGRSASTVRSWVEQGLLPAVRVPVDGRGTWAVEETTWEQFRAANRSRPFADIRERMQAMGIPASKYVTWRQLHALYGKRGWRYAKRVGALVTDATGQRLVRVQALEDFVLDALTTNMPVKPVSTGE